MTFGSAEELRVYRALKPLQARFPEHDTIAIAPLPGVRLRIIYRQARTRARKATA